MPRRSAIRDLLDRRPNLELEQPLSRTNSLELLEGPFENQFRDVTEFAPLSRSKLFKLRPQSLPDPQADLCFPFAHSAFSCLRCDKSASNQKGESPRFIRWAHENHSVGTPWTQVEVEEETRL